MSTALIIGAGERVGQSVADKFAKAGYKIAVASRSNKVKGDGYKFFPFDATRPETTADLFSKVRKDVGIPSVVVYNGAHQAYPGAENPS
jgi:NAD(P)-dependent dehydrogenase (short-subunit alcohol dehydrogenase family)